MLHFFRHIEHRFGTGSSAGRLVSGILLASLAVLLFGATLFWSRDARAQENNATPAVDPVAIATTLLDHMDAGRYADAEAMFTADMAAAVPAEQLKQVWESIPAQAGASKGRGEAAVQAQGDMQLVQVTLHFEHVELVAKVAVAGDGRVAGLLVQPAQAPAPAATPVPEGANYTERDLAVGEGDTALPGTLAMPQSDAPVPAVVLVHGSGPHDRDETIGPNKPFLDIARGLAAQGIAVLRYEKRTKARPQDFTGGDYTIDDETTNDAVAAVEALRAVDGIDADRVFVLGHSQGGMLAPRIAHKAGDVAGLVLLAAPARPLLDILVEQNVRLAVLDDNTTSDAERAAIEKLKAQVRAARAGGDVAASELPLGLPASYWRSTDLVDAPAEAAETGLPVLVLQGTRDIQVVDTDWQRWKSGLGGSDNATFNLYEGLNHLGMYGEGNGSLAEYMQPGHVHNQLIDDVAAWVKAR